MTDAINQRRHPRWQPNLRASGRGFTILLGWNSTVRYLNLSIFLLAGIAGAVCGLVLGGRGGRGNRPRVTRTVAPGNIPARLGLHQHAHAFRFYATYGHG